MFNASVILCPGTPPRKFQASTERELGAALERYVRDRARPGVTVALAVWSSDLAASKRVMMYVEQVGREVLTCPPALVPDTRHIFPVDR